MENVKAQAWMFLTSHDLGTLPRDTLMLNDIADIGFKIMSYSEAKEYLKSLKLLDYAQKYKAFATATPDGCKLIFYDNTLPFSERDFIIAHEVGHIVLGHTVTGGIIGKSNNQEEDNKQEQESDIFALAFLAPAPILAALKIYSPVEISRITGLPTQLAVDVVVDIVQEEYSKKSGIELALLDTFRDYIDTFTSPEPMPVALQEAALKQKKYSTAAITAAVVLCCTVFIVGMLGIGYTYTNLQNLQVSNTSSAPLTSSKSIPDDPISSDAVPDHQDQVTDFKVYVTSTGTKYHLPDCQHVRGKNNLRELTLSDAEKQNFVPCKVCKPDKQ